ncbi:MAG: efflux RND transporter periplasmic adaptor subunit [Acidobacteriaceae bacterium]|nr:efflux RND transporter periplasmic adaptor subunit [Acidobacteriaceae bacterium]
MLSGNNLNIRYLYYAEWHRTQSPFRQSRFQLVRVDPERSVMTANPDKPAEAGIPPVNEHPPRRRSWRWLAWIAALVILGGGIFLLSQRSLAQNSGAQNSAAGGKAGNRGARGGGGAIPVSAAAVTKGNMGVYIEALGTVTPVYTVTVTSRVAGALTEIHYKEGQMVRAGQLLAVIDPRPYTAVLTQAQGQLNRDKALLANARIDLERYSMAYSQHAVPEQTVATQKATVQQDEGTVQLDQGNVDAAQVNVDYTQIRSPIDGRAGLRQIDLGNIVAANGTTPIVTIAQLRPITVIFNMAEDFISDVVTQMRGGHKLRVDALNRDNETELAQGTVLTVDNQVDTTTGTVKVRAIYQNSSYGLFPNEFVNAKLLVKTLMGVNIIPNAAIQRNNEIAYVYVIDPATDTVHSRNVAVATTDGSNSAVTGVAPGETLVTDGFDKLQDGTKVVIRQAPAQRGTNAPATNQAQENMQAPRQGEANKNIDTAQQNPQPGKRK